MHFDFLGIFRQNIEDSFPRKGEQEKESFYCDIISYFYNNYAA